MARKTKQSPAAIADSLGARSNPVDTPPTSPGDPSPPGGGGQRAGGGQSPGGGVWDLARDYLQVDPADIHEDEEIGNVRLFLDEDEEEIEESIGEEGLLQAIGIRLTGSPVAPRFTLVWGGRRLRAVRRRGIARITVRNLGWISADDALIYQLIENSQRAATHPIDDAIGCAEAVRRLGSSAEVARRLKKSEGWVSTMRRVGEAVKGLSYEERLPFYQSPAVTARALSTLVSGATGPQQVLDRLRALIGETRVARSPAPSTSARKKEPFERREIRRGNGVQLTVRWDDALLATDPRGYLEAFEKFIAEAASDLVERCRALSGAGRSTSPEKRTERPATHVIESRDAEGPEIDEADFEAILRSFDARVRDVRKQIATYAKGGRD